MTNPFNMADKHGAPDMRVTAPPSAETPMTNPMWRQTMTAAEQVEHGHRTRGEPTYAELQAINAELLAALEKAKETIAYWHGSIGLDLYQQSPEMQIVNAAIAQKASLNDHARTCRYPIGTMAAIATTERRGCRRAATHTCRWAGRCRRNPADATG